jgi:K+-sensing histidine kinase KdpD
MNCIQFSLNDKKIGIEPSFEKDNVIILFIDYRIGISAADLEKIFKSFVRGENINLFRSTEPGLAIVKKSIDLMKKEITVLSNLENGTRYIVKLPKTEAF